MHFCTCVLMLTMCYTSAHVFCSCYCYVLHFCICVLMLPMCYNCAHVFCFSNAKCSNANSNVIIEAGSAATTEAAAPELVNTQPTRKRRASASGSRQSSACWEHFIRLP